MLTSRTASKWFLVVNSSLVVLNTLTIAYSFAVVPWITIAALAFNSLAIGATLFRLLFFSD